MKVLLLLLYFIRDKQVFAESNCSSLEVDLHTLSVEETSARFILTEHASLDDSCIVKELKYTLKPAIYSGTCKIFSKSCEFDNLKAFTNYTLTIHPIFKEDHEGTSTSVTFFTAGMCLPKYALSLKLEGEKLKWLLNSTFANILNHFAITATINQASTCGGKTFTYFEDQILHNESINLPKDVPGEWSICVEPVGKNREGICEKRNCITKDIPMDVHLAKVDKFSLTSGEKSLIAKWSPNPFWSQNCTLDYYQILYSDTSPTGRPTLANKTCRIDTCQMVIKDLLPDTNYNIQITPIFLGNIEGEMDWSTEAPYNCPSAPSDLNIERNLSHILLNWTHSNKDEADFYEIVLFSKLPCSINYTSAPPVNISAYIYVFKDVSPFLDVKIRITSLKRHEYNCQDVFIEEEKLATQKIPLRVENLHVKDISETAAEISWKYPSTWKTVCFPSLHYKVDFHSDPKAIKTFMHTSQSVKGLKPLTNYVFQIRACVNSNMCQNSKLNFTTLDMYPTIFEDSFSVDYKDLETFVDYVNGTHHHGNCSIRITDIQSNSDYLFNCTSGGKIQSKDLPSGREYKMEMEVCNSRGCKVSKPHTAYSAPTRADLPDVSVEASTSNSSIISLQFKRQNGYYNGSMYIVVSEVEVQHPGTSDVEVFVRRITHELSQGKSAMERLPTRKHIIVASVPLDTLNYDLQREFLIKEGMETSKGIYVAPVVEYWAGRYNVVVAYDFCGPFKFGGIEQMSIIVWIAGSFGSLIGIVLLIVMFQRKFHPLPKIPHNCTKKMSFSSPTYESSDHNRDLDSECEEQSLNPESLSPAKAAKLQLVTKYTKTQREFDPEENVSIN